jgi:catechol 2,3-dioxygenase-like lactoylglutathione lyase family enzyme
LPRFLQIAPRLPVADLARSIAFYTDLLDFKLGLLWPDDAPSFAILERDGVSVQLHTADESERLTVGHTTLSFDVDDARALHDGLKGRVTVEWGAEVYWYGRREFAVRDPSGYLLIFSEVTSDPPTCHDDD